MIQLIEVCKQTWKDTRRNGVRGDLRAETASAFPWSLILSRLRSFFTIKMRAFSESVFTELS